MACCCANNRKAAMAAHTPRSAASRSGVSGFVLSRAINAAYHAIHGFLPLSVPRLIFEPLCHNKLKRDDQSCSRDECRKGPKRSETGRGAFRSLYEGFSEASCSGRGSWRATTSPRLSQRVMDRSGSLSTMARNSLRAIARRRSATELGVLEILMLPSGCWETGGLVSIRYARRRVWVS